jgi:hypothetical protein
MILFAVGADIIRPQKTNINYDTGGGTPPLQWAIG